MIIRASLLTTLSTFVVFGTACSQKGGDSGGDTLRFDDDLVELDPARSSWEGPPEVSDSGSSSTMRPRPSRSWTSPWARPRAAGNLIAHRDGGDRARAPPMTTSTTPSTRSTWCVRWSADHRPHGRLRGRWLSPRCRGHPRHLRRRVLHGRSGEAMLALTNSLTIDELDYDLGLHAHARSTRQPIATVDELSRLYYVGRSALTELKALATASTSTSSTSFFPW